MKKTAFALLVTALAVSPADAAEWNDVRTGTFVGARLTIGGKTAGRPVASLTIAPTQNRISGKGIVSTSVGEGLALSFGRHQKPMLTLAGIRADRALRLNDDDDGNGKHGLSTGAWIAIGLGVAVGAGALWYSNYCHHNLSELCGDEE